MKRSLSTMRSCVCITVAFSLLLSGCLGPWGIRKNRTHYNEAIKLTSEQELLLNLVRLRYDEVPFFLSLDSVASQLALTPEAGFEAEADGGKPRYFGTGNLSFEMHNDGHCFFCVHFFAYC